MMMVAALSGVGRLMAQPRHAPLLIGLAAGVDGNLEPGDFPVFTDAPDCDRFTGGRALSGFVAGRLLLPQLFAGDLGLSIGLGAAYTTGYFVATPTDPLIVLDTALHQPLTIPNEYRLNAIFRDLRLDFLANYPVGGGFAVGAGAAFGYRYSADFRQIDVITGTGADRFRSGSRQEALPGGIDFSPSPIIVDALLRVSYQAPSRSRLLIAPEITVRAGLASPVREAAWRTFGAGIGVAVLYNPLAEPELQVPPPAIAPALADTGSGLAIAPAADTISRTETITHGRQIRASIELFGVGDRGERLSVATVQIFDTHHHLAVPVPEAIRFERGSAVIEGRYRMLRPGETELFMIDSLGPDDIEAQTLNILGSRLRGDSAAGISLSGFSDRDESPALGSARVAAVRRYLADVWNIDTSRLSIDPHADKHATGRDNDNPISRRVVLVSGGEPLMLRLATPGRIDHDLEPPLIALDPHIDADAGVRSWRITLSHQGRTVGSYTSRHPDGAGTGSSEWRVGEDISGELPDPLIAELTVEDSLGGLKTVSSRIPIVVRRYSRDIDSGVAGGVEFVSAGLFPGSVDSGVVGQRNSAAAAEIAGRIRTGATVSISCTGNIDGAARLVRIIVDVYRQRYISNVAMSIRGADRRLILGSEARGGDLFDITVRQPLVKNGGRRGR
ncbi:MAG: hypothetical protein JWQ98_2470 [Chlorobi bacterium]|nr:hypothetical protein [Chlorobiota bacterium]